MLQVVKQKKNMMADWNEGYLKKLLHIEKWKETSEYTPHLKSFSTFPFSLQCFLLIFLEVIKTVQKDNEWWQWRFKSR